VTEADTDHFDMSVIIINILDQLLQGEDPAVGFIIHRILASGEDYTFKMFKFFFRWKFEVKCLVDSPLVS
jgi:hypothetical protein